MEPEGRGITWKTEEEQSGMGKKQEKQGGKGTGVASVAEGN